jgi:hypothetical protein
VPALVVVDDALPFEAPELSDAEHRAPGLSDEPPLP